MKGNGLAIGLGLAITVGFYMYVNNYGLGTFVPKP